MYKKLDKYFVKEITLPEMRRMAAHSMIEGLKVKVKVEFEEDEYYKLETEW